MTGCSRVATQPIRGLLVQPLGFGFGVVFFALFVLAVIHAAAADPAAFANDLGAARTEHREKQHDTVTAQRLNRHIAP